MTIETTEERVATDSSPAVSTVAYSVVIEWENVKLAESARASEMLRRLSKQMSALARRGRRGEVLMICDGEDPRANHELAHMLRNTFGASAANVQVLTIAGKYYEKKNRGASSARGPIVLFLDSDVVPEDHWLERMISSFDHEEVQVVGGTTYLDPTSLYTKAFAAFWFFPPRSEEEVLEPAQLLFANNIAFRRKLILENPLPDLPDFRGQLGTLIRKLRGDGESGIYVHRGARCSHPAPNGFVHFVRRAMCEGHDNVIRTQRETGQSSVPWTSSYPSVRALLGREFRAIHERAKVLELGVTTVATAQVLALAYAAITAMGEAATRVNPAWVRRHFAI